MGKNISVAKFYCLHVTSPWPITLVKTHGPSMLPTIDLMNVFLGERIPTRFGKVALARGDIIVLRSPRNPRKFIVKRLVGMEGDSITYNSRTQKTNKHTTVLVPKGHVWVQGDNIYNSKDSTHFGPVPYGHIQRRIFWRVWPLEKFGPFWKKHLKLSTMR
ncbi:mitochondrial ATP-independent inner membrane protease subunit 1a-like [Gastrolobium bilobum]|uniref:mitochondrial ATP-independent inner membrane protease subunit 1a-like n=1 Tax=Gastrolobium bilobum TaxID=150636 RepID=UPI002AB03D42|nr:mitochondrial ATP-independent inner membrane protease subunit 1a-like [Gastrolobium bilobum]